MKKTIVRMPPSPTGHLHLGTARTALFNYLFAKKTGGEIVFRWEDTDKERSDTRFEKEILDGLKWLGMDFEKESSIFCRQSENLSDHKKYLAQLWQEKKAFPCFTTKEELEISRNEAQKNKQNFVFWSPWRDFPHSEAEKKMATMDFVWRLKVPKNHEISYQDLIRGNHTVNTNTIGDFVVARADGSVLYMLANVADDITHEITHVIRGEDHVSNTPKQILIYESLNKKIPEFAHIPLVLDSSRKKLSKRNVQVGVCVLIKDFIRTGFIPEGVVNGLAFLGWNPKSTEEIFDLEKLTKIFDLGNINKASAQYDFEKMKWFNSQWMKYIPIEKFAKYYQEFVGVNIKEIPNLTNNVLNLAREKGHTISEVDDELSYLIKNTGIDKNLLINLKFGLDETRVKEVLNEIIDTILEIDENNFNKEFIREKSVEKIAELKIKNGEFLWPFRVALSNRQNSFGPFEISEVIGKDETLNRLEEALKLF